MKKYSKFLVRSQSKLGKALELNEAQIPLASKGSFFGV